MNYTAGPWQAQPVMAHRQFHNEADHFRSILFTAEIPGKRKHVCDLDFGYGQKTDNANARLIARAPDLLDALRRIRSALHNLGGMGAYAEEALRIATQAIIQAEGKEDAE